MSESEREWQEAQDVFERALRRRLRMLGEQHAGCAFRAVVLKGDEVRVYCQHEDAPNLDVEFEAEPAGPRRRETERSQVWG